MTTPDTFDSRKRCAVTVALFVVIACALSANWSTFQLVGFVDALALCLVGGGSLFIVAISAFYAHRRVPSSGIFVTLTAILVGFIWACPLTPRTRFFATTAQVHVGMPVHRTQKLLWDTDLTYLQPGLKAFSPKTGNALRYAQPDRHFSGVVVCKPNSSSGDVTTITVRDGIVTGVYPYANL